MRVLTCFTAAVLLVAAAGVPAHAGTLAYGMAFDELYRIDLETRRAEYVGSAGNYGGQPYGNLKALTFGPDGTLYAVSDSLSTKPLVRIDPVSGRASAVGPVNFGTSGSGQYPSLDLGAAFTCDGRLWMSSATTGKLWNVDPASGATTLIGSLGHTVTGLVARGNALYGAGGRGDNAFYRIDTSTGAATRVGAFGPTGWINSVAMNVDGDDMLWAVLNYNPPEPGSSTLTDWSDLATIDRNTGALTRLGTITGPSRLRGLGMTGFAIGPTPCGTVEPEPVATPVRSPWALGLLGLALFAGAARRLRRTR